MEGINTLLIWMVIFYILIGIAALIKNILYKKKLLASGIYEIDQMKGTTFEDYLETLLKTKGYQVKQTPKTGDYGADLILTKDQIKIAVQAKRYKNKVGIKALQEISSAKKYYNVDESWVITNN